MPGIAAPFVIEALLDLVDGVEPETVGGAVTVALGSRCDHEPPCHWPDNDEARANGDRIRFRTLYVSEPVEEPEVRRRIEAALRGVEGRAVLEPATREVADDERALAG